MRLLVTRPEPDGERTAGQLRARGHAVLLAPLMRFAPLERPDISAAWAGVILTSANAIRALDTDAVDHLRALPALAVGEHTAQAARAAGFAAVQSADGDAGDVVRLAARMFAQAQAPLLYLSGEARARDIAAALAAHGIRVVTVPVYRMLPEARLPPPAAEALAAGAIDGVLHYSRRSAEAYLACATAGGCLPAALAPTHYCLSQEVARALQAAGATSVRISPRPDEASLLALIVND